MIMTGDKGKKKATTEMRIEALERKISDIQDSVKMLQKMLKQQSELIKEYITEQIVAAENNNGNGKHRPEDAVYTFICKQRFGQIEQELQKVRETVEQTKSGLKHSYKS